MALIPKFTLVCDEVRREDNGKLLVIGMYTPGIVVPRFPVTLPKLTFLTAFDTSAVERFDLNFRLTIDAIGAVVGAEGRATVQITDPAGGLYLPIAIPNVQFQMPGTYVFSVTGENFGGLTFSVPVTQQQAQRIH